MVYERTATKGKYSQKQDDTVKWLSRTNAHIKKNMEYVGICCEHFVKQQLRAARIVVVSLQSELYKAGGLFTKCSEKPGGRPTVAPGAPALFLSLVTARIRSCPKVTKIGVYE